MAGSFVPPTAPSDKARRPREPRRTCRSLKSKLLSHAGQIGYIAQPAQKFEIVPDTVREGFGGVVGLEVFLRQVNRLGLVEATQQQIGMRAIDIDPGLRRIELQRIFGVG